MIFNKRHKHNGELCTVQFFKELYGVSQRYTSGQQFNKIPYTKCDGDLLPSILGPFKSYLEGSLNQRRAVLTVLSLYKLVPTVNNKYDLDSINAGYDRQFGRPPITDQTLFDQYYEANPTALNKSIAEGFKQVVNDMFPSNSIPSRMSRIKSLSTLHISSKNGPNGPALETMSLDYLAIHDLKIMNRVARLTALTENHDLANLIRDLKSNPPEVIKLNKPLTHSRLSFKQEPGGKVRVFAIGDYFTQSSLKGFHDYLFGYLHGLPEDGTHNQNYVSQVAKEWSQRQENAIYSVDLSKATDQIPSELMGYIVKQIGGEDFGNLWFVTMVDRDFTITGLPEQTISYSKGQPMGFYSSWGMLALWHHAILKTCLHVLNKRSSIDDVRYVIIGDDVAMLDKDVADLYHYIVEGICKVDVSPLKGFSPDTKVNGRAPLHEHSMMNSVEIAKRVFIDGLEISPISPVLISEALRKPDEFPNLFTELEEKGITLPSYALATYALSRYCDRPRASLEAATFPLTGAPTGVTIEVDGSVTWPLQNRIDVFWFNNVNVNRDIINLVTGKLLIKKSKIALAKFEESAQRYNESMSDHIWSIRGNEIVYKSRAQSNFYHSIVVKARERLVRLYGEYQAMWINPLNKMRTKDNDMRTVKRMLGKFQLLLELSSVFDKSRTRQSVSKQQFASKLVTQVTSSLKYFFGLPGENEDKMHMFEQT